MKKYLFYINMALFAAVLWSFYNKRNIQIKVPSVVNSQVVVNKQLTKEAINIDNKNIEGKIHFNNNSFSNLKINYNNKKYNILNCDSSWSTTWNSKDSNTPNNDQWSSNSESLSSDKPLILTWKSPEGSIFVQSMQIVDDYIVKVEYSVFNALSKPINIGLDLLTEKVKGNFIYQKDDATIRASKKHASINTNSWHGFEDEYSAFAVIPKNNISYSYNSNDSSSNVAFPSQTINPKESSSWSFYVFAGPKKLSILKKYAKKYEANGLENLINYGFLSIITKTIFAILSYILSIFDNFAFAICLLTLIVKIILAPFSYKSHISMMKIQKLQPQIERIKEVNKGNNVATQQSILALYKQESINPLGGILPFVFQIPLFISLYAAISISIDSVNAGFLWIKDLSISDPYSVNNLIKYFTAKSLPFDINLLSALFSITMIAQQWNTLKKQKDNFILALPLVSAVLLSSYSSAFMIYMIWSNILAYLQSIIFNRIIKKNYAN
ncbi:membrane protein insertase YidC [Candidatus Cytomitobacter indipagum]|uniref:Membrane protein insertase YidC n=1 Tax=Candidatus Cytomitobacter indipagum TaxID=2601575 RepID=A0A5C0UDE1_9PROT|nr:membrane protein insertase YidC [Candidatus Cytomitobacter indipagum]QEK38056.1 membrane protein insertase YidC [Candidatus Cytomitobacter indipagum]